MGTHTHTQRERDNVVKPNNLISLSMGTDKEDKMDLGADATSVGLKALSSLVSPCVSRALARLARRGGVRAQAARICFYNNAIRGIH